MELSTQQVNEIVQEVRANHPDINWHDRFASPLYVGASKRQLTDKVAIMSSPYKDEDMDPVCIGIGGKESYDLLADEVVLYYMEKMIPTLEYGEGKLTHHVGLERARFTWDFPLMEKKMAKVGDIISLRINMVNGSDVMTKLRGEAGGLCLKCLNGMTGFNNGIKIGMNHRNLNLDSIFSSLRKSSNLFSEQMENWNKLAEETIAAPEMEEFMTLSGWGGRYAEEIRALPLLNQDKVTVDSLLSTKGEVSAWSLYSAMTQFLTHNVKSEEVRVQRSNQVERAFSRFYN